jgi:hypothetical protein
MFGVQRTPSTKKIGTNSGTGEQDLQSSLREEMG